MGPKNWRVFQKASDAGAIAAEITQAVLQEKQKAKEEDNNEAFFVTGRGPVRLAVKSIIAVGLGEKETQSGKRLSSENHFGNQHDSTHRYSKNKEERHDRSGKMQASLSLPTVHGML